MWNWESASGFVLCYTSLKKKVRIKTMYTFAEQNLIASKVDTIQTKRNKEANTNK